MLQLASKTLNFLIRPILLTSNDGRQCRSEAFAAGPHPSQLRSGYVTRMNEMESSWEVTSDRIKRTVTTITSRNSFSSHHQGHRGMALTMTCQIRGVRRQSFLLRPSIGDTLNGCHDGTDTQHGHLTDLVRHNATRAEQPQSFVSWRPSTIPTAFHGYANEKTRAASHSQPEVIHDQYQDSGVSHNASQATTILGLSLQSLRCGAFDHAGYSKKAMFSWELLGS